MSCSLFKEIQLQLHRNAVQMYSELYMSNYQSLQESQQYKLIKAFRPGIS